MNDVKQKVDSLFCFWCFGACVRDHASHLFVLVFVFVSLLLAETDYSNEKWPTSAKILDIIRCSLIYDNCDDLMAGLNNVLTRITKQDTVLKRVVRIKNLYVCYFFVLSFFYFSVYPCAKRLASTKTFFCFFVWFCFVLKNTVDL